MSALATLLLVACGLAILLLPRRLAPLALLAGTCYVTRAQGIDLGPFSFTVARILTVLAVLRIAVRGEWLQGFRRLDALVVAWGLGMVATVAFHRDPSGQVVERLGLVLDAGGAYFLIRCSCRTWEEIATLCRLSSLILLPTAAEMIVEKATAHNFFAVLFGGVPEIPTIREGHVRAQGPFGHAILAGTIGAICLPLVLGVWRQHRTSAAIGAITCVIIVVTSTSSGPILSAVAGVGAVFAWRYRAWTRAIRWSAVFAYIGLGFVMKDPAYFILARIDLTGGSTGWHRARLIQSSIEHIDEWWLAGTDYTRHWMASGVSWSPDHTDITNHYLQMGVLGGLPLMILFIAVVVQGFMVVGRGLERAPDKNRFTLWCLGSSWFAHAVTGISVSYFDQSAVFLYLTLGLVGSSQSASLAAAQKEIGDAQPGVGPSRVPLRNRQPALTRHPALTPVVQREKESRESPKRQPGDKQLPHTRPLGSYRAGTDTGVRAPKQRPRSGGR